ncbi:hypothetical protein BTW10_15155 [Chromohalobacter japonicus]|uniref:DUF4168 domain-containing protein n=1 Tax=Chromohalobacter japonicus TaxID=223900 RepID=A0A1Q8T9L9_9GAMM|nr:DUF4168 domain-containing protein [Chromohalobacter japonicus]OLO10380.1 hypothetical protein BTW10_15155 [Chromohalobacter japonicus]
MQRITALVSAAMLTTGMVAAQAAMAQQEDPAASGTTQTQGASSQDFSDEQLQQFADASEEISKVSQKYTKQLQNADGEDKQKELREKANEEMVSVVEDSGMSVEEFNSIGQAIQQDPELMQRVQGMVQGQQQ